MRIGLRKSPHLELLVEGIRKCGDTFTSEYDGGADYYLAWGWPQAEQVERDSGRPAADIICMDAHPFALRAGDRSGGRILQLGNWGRLAHYPPLKPVEVPLPRDQSRPGGPVLVLGHVSSTEQIRGGLVDVWYTPGGDAWLRDELLKDNRKFRPHPRMWNEPRPQPSLAEDLQGCSCAIGWNSTAVLHARMLGYPTASVEAHGWGFFELEELAAQLITPRELRDGSFWAEVYRPWLVSRKEEARV